MSSEYIVKRGDSPIGIARKHGISLNDLYRLNPGIKGKTIYPDDVLKTAPDTRKEAVNLKDRWALEEEANKTNLGAIQAAYHTGNYMVIDKAGQNISIFDKDNNILFSTNRMSSGRGMGDYNTITYTKIVGYDKKGNPIREIIDGAGNMSTPAGITKITDQVTYKNVPAFYRKRYNKATGRWENVASSVHKGSYDIPYKTNGCVRVNGLDLIEMANYVGVDTPVYTLPTDDKSRFTVREGRLNYTADDPIGKNTGKKEFWDDYNTYVEKDYRPVRITSSKWTAGAAPVHRRETFSGYGSGLHDDVLYNNNKRTYMNTLMSTKEYVQKRFDLSSYEYNRLALLACALAEQETKYGIAPNFKKKMLPDFAIKGFKILAHWKKTNTWETPNLDVSKGLTQIKLEEDRRNNENLVKFYDEVGVDEDAMKFGDARSSALATIGRLAEIYSSEVRGRKFKGVEGKDVSGWDAILYKWLGQNYKLKKGIANPETNTYIQNIRKYEQDFDLYEDMEYEE